MTMKNRTVKRKAIVSAIAGIVLSAVAFYFAFRNVRLGELIDYLASVNYFWLLPTSVIVVVAFAVRALRWKVILGTDCDVPFWRAFHPLMIGFMLNCILPGRVGELARPAVLQQRDKVPFSTGLATVAAERVFDLGMLLVLFAVAMSVVTIDPALDIPFGEYHLNEATLKAIVKGMLKLSLLLVAGILFISYEKTRRFVSRLISAIPSLFIFTGESFKKKIEEKVISRALQALENFAIGFSLIRHPKKIGVCIILSIIVWSLQPFSFYVMSLGCPGIDLSFSQMTAYLVIICFFIALPSVPGFWGLWEAGGLFALALFGIHNGEAAGFTLANHAVQIIPVVVVGLVSAFVTGVSILRVSFEKTESADSAT